MSDQAGGGKPDRDAPLESPRDDPSRARNVRFRDVAPAIEFACWVVVLLAPLLRLINGSAVTNDQFVIQVVLFCLALTGAVGLRIFLACFAAK